MGLFPTDAIDGDEVTNTNGTTFKYVAADDKWVIVSDIVISDVAYNEGTWDANPDAASKDAIRDKVVAMDALIDDNTTVIEVEGVITAELVDGQSIDNRIDALITAEGHPNHNDLAGLNAGDVYEHISQAQKDALHPQLTNLTELATRNHADLQNILAAQHHASFVQGDADALYSVLAHLHDDRYYTEAEVNNAIDADITTHEGNPGDINHLTDVQVAALHAKQHAMDNATYHTSSDIATLNSSTTKHGFLKKLDNNALNYMNGQGNWTEPAGVGGISEADAFALLGVGIANKRWRNCILEGSNNNTWHTSNIAYYGSGSNDFQFVFGIPLDYIIGGTHNLVITRLKIGVADTDISDFIDRVRIIGWSDYDSFATLVDLDWDALYGKDIEENINDHADITIGGAYERILILVHIVSTTANELDISYIQVEYYYA